ncbi:MAG TPA: hypothetical protein VKK79_02395 [Candidatus Lokiarchaeia archaeon]|nr:hypothetical protein [Candidatus Lokiarchaeia archaeon]
MNFDEENPEEEEEKPEEHKAGFRAVSQKKGGAKSAADQAKKVLDDLDLDDDL